MEAENLALRPGARITASVCNVTGPGARDPAVLLNERLPKLPALCRLADFDQSLTYDTYDGQNSAAGPDWYALEFAEPAACNCIELTVGFPYRDGGWWTSLAVEVCPPGEAGWLPVEHLCITPAPSFADDRSGRRPFETYTLTFPTCTVEAIRVIGRPGGIAQFTSLARIALYLRPQRRTTAGQAPKAPQPRIFRIVPPAMVWDMSEGLVKLSGLTVGMPFMEFYLDEPRYQQRWRRLRHNYQGAPELWFLLGETLGWDAWNRLGAVPAKPSDPAAPYLRMHMRNALASAVAPVVLEGEVLAEIKTHPVLLTDHFDWRWHRAFAREHAIAWPAYREAVRRSIHMSREQLEGAALLVGTIANTVANLAHQLDRLTGTAGLPELRRKEIVWRALRFMEEHVEEPIDVPDIAAAVSLSPSYFGALFAQETGHTPGEALTGLRLERAKHYLAQTDLSVHEIGVALGYSRSHFSRLFRQYVGCSPSEYAARQRA